MTVHMGRQTSLLAAGKVLWILPVSTLIPMYLVDVSFQFWQGSRKAAGLVQKFLEQSSILITLL